MPSATAVDDSDVETLGAEEDGAEAENEVGGAEAVGMEDAEVEGANVAGAEAAGAEAADVESSLTPRQRVVTRQRHQGSAGALTVCVKAGPAFDALCVHVCARAFTSHAASHG